MQVLESILNKKNAKKKPQQFERIFMSFIRKYLLCVTLFHVLKKKLYKIKNNILNSLEQKQKVVWMSSYVTLNPSLHSACRLTCDRVMCSGEVLISFLQVAL